MAAVPGAIFSPPHLAKMGHFVTPLMLIHWQKLHLCKKDPVNALFLHNCRYVGLWMGIFFIINQHTALDKR